MKKTLRLVACVLTLTALCLAASGAAFAQNSTPDGAGPPTGELILKECSVCHTTSRICASMEDKDLEQWKKTVEHMHSKGAGIDSEQVSIVAGYLASAEPGTSRVCTEGATGPVGPLSTTVGRLVLMGHPVMMGAAILLALATLRMGVQRFRFNTLGHKVRFEWKTHTRYGYTVFFVWLAGMAAGSILVKVQWGQFGATGLHRVVAYYMFALILFGLGTGYLMDRFKKQRKWLPLLHGLGNTVLVLLSLWQIQTGLHVVFGMIY